MHPLVRGVRALDPDLDPDEYDEDENEDDEGDEEEDEEDDDGEGEKWYVAGSKRLRREPTLVLDFASRSPYTWPVS